MWASAHHERIDGTGYYLGLKKEEIPLEARLIAVADVYSALAAHRPYRRGMDKEKIVDVMYGMAKNNHLDKKLVNLILDLLSSHPGDLSLMKEVNTCLQSNTDKRKKCFSTFKKGK